MTAADDARSLITNTLDEYSAVVARLVETYGVFLVWAPLGDDIGHWDGHRRTATVNIDSAVDDQAWFVREIETLCSIGEHAVPAARRMAHLRLVD